MGYESVQRELAAGTPSEVICATCPWDRLCVQPPTMTKADIDQQIEDATNKARENDPTGQKATSATLVTALVFAGKDVSGQMCPVFSLRLRSRAGRGISDGIRDQMQNWTEEL